MTCSEAMSRTPVRLTVSKRLPYHALMFMDRGASIIRPTMWGLLSLRMFFGCLELVEESRIIPALTEDAQEGEDVDEAALAQLASGLKSDRSHLESPHSHS